MSTRIRDEEERGDMAVQFAVLASGSRGNSAYIAGSGGGLLIDCGLSVKALGERLAAVGAGWSRVGAVLLTHTHSDHVDPAALGEMAERRIPLHCHGGHAATLADHAGYQELDRLGLVRRYHNDPFLTAAGALIDPIALSHDGGPTYGFHIEIRARDREPVARIGFLADTGRWTDDMVARLVDVDLLSLEFNHDVVMQRSASRPAHLIARNLGDRGHLSNDQAGAFVRAVAARSRPDQVRDVVLLHLSEQCNTPELALEAAQSAAGAGRRVHAARQHEPHPNLAVTAGKRGPRTRMVPADRKRTSARAARSSFATGLLFDQESPLDPTPVEIS